jgi:hypothetical protein
MSNVSDFPGPKRSNLSTVSFEDGELVHEEGDKEDDERFDFNITSNCCFTND